MDAINLLPYELWREILFHTTSFWLYTSKLLSNQASSFEPVNVRIHRAEVQHKRSLLCICKFLQPISEEHLYTEVALTSFKMFRKFVACASRTRPQKRCHGEWTRSLIVCFDWSSKAAGQNTTYLDELVYACPNLRSLHVRDETFRELGIKSIWEDNLCNKLQILDWSGKRMKWGDLANISLLCTNLYQLGLYACEENTMKTRQPIVFASVQHFGFGPGCYHCINIMELNFPKLSKLSVDIDFKGIKPQIDDRPGPVVEFLRREGPKLSTLGISMSEYPSANVSALEIFGICKNLSTFLLDANRLNPLDNSEQENMPYNSLSELVLLLDSIPDEVQAEMERREAEQEAKSEVNVSVAGGGSHNTGFINATSASENNEDMEEDDYNDESSEFSSDEEPSPTLKLHSAYFCSRRFPHLNSILVIFSEEYTSPLDNSERFMLWDYVSRLFPQAKVRVVDHL